MTEPAGSRQLLVRVKEQLERERGFESSLNELRERISQGERETAIPILAKLRAVHSEGNALLGELRDLSDHLFEHPFEETLAEFNNRLSRLSNGAAFRGEKLADLETLLKTWAEEPIVSPPALTKYEGSLPIAAYFLLDRLLAKADREAILGDMEEEFRTKFAKGGPTLARRWLWRETVWTIAQRNPVCRSILVGGLMRLIEWIFRQIGG
jgi:hypothetical protein